MKNKKSLVVIFLFSISLIFINSCNKITVFDISLLPGKWQQGTLYYTYNSDGTGKTWDTADDVQEDEAQTFDWYFTNPELTQEHKMEIGSGIIPKIYTITTLTSTTLSYTDSFEVTHTFTKVTE